MAKNKNKIRKKKTPPIPGAPKGQPAQQRKPERVIPPDIDNDCDNMIEALIHFKRDWKLLISGFSQAQQELSKLKKK